MSLASIRYIGSIEEVLLVQPKKHCFENMYHPFHEEKEVREKERRGREQLAKTRNIKKSRGILNPVLISIVIILYLLPDTSIIYISGGSLAHKGDTSSRGKLIGLAMASPVPEPTAAVRAKTSSRNPPMNGSIFGKRSLNEEVNHKQNVNSQSDLLAKSKPSISSRQKSARRELINYNDIITDIIEDFLKSNNESDPEETSVAFCRMIVYECNQMLSGRRKTPRRRQY